jgi:hypothetical protein
MKRGSCATVCLTLTIAGVVSCGPTIADNRNGIVRQMPVPAATPNDYNQAQRASDLAIFKKFAESYEPRSGREVIPSPPVADEKILKIIENLVSAQSREHEKYVLLIFIRLSRFQVEHFRQRYELGRDNPLTKEFYRLIGREASINPEFMPAYLADKYVEAHPELLEYPLINVEMKRIAKAESEIKKSISN